MMKKLLYLSILLLGAVAYVSPAYAQPLMPPGLADKGPLTKITFIHYRKGYAKPDGVGNPSKPPKGSSCYGFLANGAKWKTTEPYQVNPNNSDGMADSFVLNAVNAGVAEWENYGGNIFGSGALNPAAVYDDTVTDGQNVTAFGDYPDPGVIAVTNVWGYFYGPPKTRELVEWDMLFNEQFAWGDADVNPSLMDLQNIATHELGHSAGMDDLYETTCQQETMYGYSTEGEISKRDLNTGDIAGIQKLY